MCRGVLADAEVLAPGASIGGEATARQALKAKLGAQGTADMEKQLLRKANSRARGVEKFVIPDPYQPKDPTLGSGLLFFPLANGPNWAWPIAGGVSAFLLILLVALGSVGWFLGRAVVRPLAAMSWAAQGIALGHFDVRLPASRVREVAQASAALEEMSAAQDLPHLFTPLYRGESSRNRQTGGAGLGLAIARRILQSHGGDLTVANRAAGGAAFTGAIPNV